MKILLAHFFSFKNLGDVAISLSMVRHLRKNIPSASISLSCIDSSDGPFEEKEVSSVRSLFWYAVYARDGTFDRVLRSVYVLLICFIYTRVSKKLGCLFATQELWKILQSYIQADAVVMVGGGYINGKNTFHDSIALFFSLHEVNFTKKLGKPVWFFPQSYGPFGNKFQRWMVKKTFSDVSEIVVRDIASKETLVDLGIREDQIIFTTDCAFGLDPVDTQEGGKILSECGVNTSKPVVAFTIRNWFSGPNQEKLESSYADCVEHLVQKGYEVVLVPQVTASSSFENDREPSERVIDRCGSPSVYLISKPLTVSSIQSVYGSCAFVVGMRMHSCILSFVQGVPAIGVAYEPKTTSMFRRMALEDMAVLVENVNGNLLIDLCEKLLKNRGAYQIAVQTASHERRIFFETYVKKVVAEMMLLNFSSLTWTVSK